VNQSGLNIRNDEENTNVVIENYLKPAPKKGRKMWRNCRLTTKNPDCQFRWAILDESK
jgi:hypothetical protein